MSSDSPHFPGKTITFRDKSFPLLQTRPMSSLSLDTVEAIKLVTLDPSYPPNIVGSFKYIVHEYPADIDLFEKYNSCCNQEQASKDVGKKIQKMIRRISQRHDIYLGDFKAGYDHRYKISIGQIRGNKLVNYDAYRIRTAIIALQRQGLLTNDEADLWLSKVIDQPSVYEYMDLEKTLRGKYVIRWKQSELLRGEKLLPLWKRLTLKEALLHKSVVKIDLWVKLNNRYVEMTNWYMLTYTDESGKTRNMSVKPEKYEQSLMHDIQHYMEPTVNRYMKLAKRLWLYAVLMKNKKLMVKLYPLFSSGAAKMYQIMGEIETIDKILQNVKTPYIDSIVANMEDWKTRLGTIMSDVLPIPVAHVIYSKINSMIENRQNTESILHELADITEKLNFFVNRYVKLYFKRKQLRPEQYS